MTTDVESLRGFSEALRQTPTRATRAASVALNEGAKVAERLGREYVFGELNLEKSYVNRHLFVDQESKRTDLIARIRANNRATLAPRFGAEVATEQAKSPLDRLKGDPSRSISRGQKAAGSTAWRMTRRGTARAWKNAFFVTLKDSGAWAMVARQGDGEVWGRDLQVISGITVGQSFRSGREEIAPKAMSRAQEVFDRELGGL